MTTEQDWTYKQLRVQQILDMWRVEGDPPEGGDPIALVQRAVFFDPFPGGLTKEDLDVLIDAYSGWMRAWKDEKEARLRELERVREIAWRALEESPGCTLVEAMRVMAARGNEEARQELARWGGLGD